ncbi:TetR family transcriptional regulator [Rhizobium sp. 32-5/1]|uniref:TetR/AcrR family transcriptional regulator n=1 Tax=Rhizobium sp. 32-5/1 TaxID=3019602 RepID=UPI00240D7ECD|nr:TetR/AcrR family transcriptional regulator [Rhizobium sp. 32-5/1]WEZ83656.1 TetR family transcriptional regulator [Rhizobium sp. 32-5/1]
MDEKKQQIVAAASDVFIRYGFKKTSMQDIADAAMMSRGALYLHFRNKEDLFHSLMQWHHAGALQEAEDAFRSPLPFADRMEAALMRFTLALMAPVKASTHGEELFEANMRLAPDITAATSARLKALLESDVTLAAERGELSLDAIGLSVAALADLLYACADGIKKADSGLGKLEDRVKALMRVVAVATRPD